jgi:hypothetical protein
MTQPTTSAVRGAPSAATGPYVINLCASTTPMALSRPTAPELARFTFFVSRRREEGRERFRLHMGYFATRDEAEQLLSLIRDLYPAAWVGEAPGKRLAARAEGAAPAAAAAARPAAAPPAQAAAANQPVAPPPAARSEPPATRATGAVAAGGPAHRPATQAPASARTQSNPAPVTERRPAAATTPASPAQPAAAAPAVRRVPPSNVREVLDSLDAAPSAVQRAVPAAPATASVPPAPRARPATAPQASVPQASAPQASTPSQPARATPSPPAARQSAAAPPTAAAAPAVPAKRPELSDSQVLRILETRRANAVAQSAAVPTPRSEADIRMLSPDDTQTWRDIKSQLSRDAAVHFAVQLEWSVSPIDLDRVPPLAIFNAYTLYKIEGNRDGRKWYGLRLGFFSDAVAARQVALYIRSEFATVAVVPVSAKERGDATQVGAIELSRAIAPAVAKEDDAIELIDDAVEAALSRSQQPLADPEAALASEPVAAAPPAAADAAAPRRQGRPRGSPQTLEETLEILGASQLSIDNGTGVRLDLGSGARRSEPRNSTFSKLLDRLSEKLRG